MLSRINLYRLQFLTRGIRRISVSPPIKPLVSPEVPVSPPHTDTKDTTATTDTLTLARLKMLEIDMKTLTVYKNHRETCRFMGTGFGIISVVVLVATGEALISSTILGTGIFIATFV